MTTGYIIGLFFFACLVLACGITAWSARSIHQKEAEREMEFQKWFKECRHHAYILGYSSSCVENLAREAFEDYFNVGMSPAEAVLEYFK